jgi:hypothetical protein
MAKLTIDLQDGFSDDTVIVRVNGREILREDHVSTRDLVGKARSVTTDVPLGPARIEIELPDRGLVERRELDVSADRSLGISVEHGHIHTIVSDHGFFYG